MRRFDFRRPAGKCERPCGPSGRRVPQGGPTLCQAPRGFGPSAQARGEPRARVLVLLGLGARRRRAARPLRPTPRGPAARRTGGPGRESAARGDRGFPPSRARARRARRRAGTLPPRGAARERGRGQPACRTRSAPGAGSWGIPARPSAASNRAASDSCRTRIAVWASGRPWLRPIRTSRAASRASPASSAAETTASVPSSGRALPPSRAANRCRKIERAETSASAEADAADPAVSASQPRISGESFSVASAKSERSSG